MSTLTDGQGQLSPMGLKAKMKSNEPDDDINSDLLIDRLTKAMEAKQINAKALSIKAGIANTYVSDLLAKRSRSPGAWALVRIANALDVPLAYLLGQDHDAPRPNVGLLDPLPVIGAVQTGVFRPLRGEQPSGRSEMRHRDFPNADHFWFEVNDNSMNACADGAMQKGMRALCFSMAGAGLLVEGGRLYVLVRSEDGKLGEWLIRRAHVFADKTIFRAESDPPGQFEDIVEKTPVPIDDALLPKGRRTSVIARVFFYGKTVD